MIALLFISALYGGYLCAQDSELGESEAAPEDSIIQDTAFIDSSASSGREVNLLIEEFTGTNKIGQFLQQQRYRLNYSLDSIPEERIDEYVADMRARRSVKSTIYGIYKPIPMREWPWIMEFSSNVYTGFKPVNPLVIFGY